MLRQYPPNCLIHIPPPETCRCHGVGCSGLGWPEIPMVFIQEGVKVNTQIYLNLLGTVLCPGPRNHSLTDASSPRTVRHCTHRS